MTIYCAPCERDFKEQSHLDQHLRLSRAHRHTKPTQKQSQPGGQGIQKQLSHRPKNYGGTDWPTPNEVGSHSRTATMGKNQQQRSLATPSVDQGVRLQKSRWTIIPESEHESALESLVLHSHSLEVLEARKFLVRPYIIEDTADKSRSSKRCRRCNTSEAKSRGEDCTFHPSKRNKYNVKRPYKCCPETDGKGCTTVTGHNFQLPPHVSRYTDFRETPASDGQAKASAVVLDCEMAGVVGNATGEPILVCAIDYVSGATILNHYVFPSQPINQMRSQFHGVTKETLHNAHSQGLTLAGWEGARTELWKHIDENTILIGHALDNDLSALRIIHRRVVDSGILARSAIGKGGQCSLQALCAQLPRVEIRKNIGGIHDCLEDVLATREVVLFCTRKRDEFKAWVVIQQAEQARLEEERAKLRLEREQEKAREKLKLEKETVARGIPPV
ncbi:ribonuclease H-like domain-containing protein [Leptodontidium sp. MPI-SDFR-AT-0119]|nr:ribonuclease H-like domain-containing protein [Leptodontidium sp. MPI-SDFR-AT-0119]